MNISKLKQNSDVKSRDILIISLNDRLDQIVSLEEFISLRRTGHKWPLIEVVKNYNLFNKLDRDTLSKFPADEHSRKFSYGDYSANYVYLLDLSEEEITILALNNLL